VTRLYSSGSRSASSSNWRITGPAFSKDSRPGEDGFQGIDDLRLRNQLVVGILGPLVAKLRRRIGAEGDEVEVVVGSAALALYPKQAEGVLVTESVGVAEILTVILAAGLLPPLVRELEVAAPR